LSFAYDGLRIKTLGTIDLTQKIGVMDGSGRRFVYLHMSWRRFSVIL
jgi:hypothetical protein